MHKTVFISLWENKELYDFFPSEVFICSLVRLDSLYFYFHRLSSPQKDELDDIPIELSKVQSVKVRSYITMFLHL